jgi:hypothetical protein
LTGEKKANGGEMAIKIEKEENFFELRKQILGKIIEKYLHTLMHILVTFSK